MVTLAWVCVGALGLVGVLKAAEQAIAMMEDRVSAFGVAFVFVVAKVAALMAWATAAAGAVTLSTELRRHGRPGRVGLTLGGFSMGVAILANLLSVVAIWWQFSSELLATPLLNASWLLNVSQETAIPAALLALCIVTARLAGRELRALDPTVGGDIVAAHRHSSRHREEVRRSELGGCFYCLQTFPPAAIREWTDERDAMGVTALCPHCGIDSVIGDASGFPVTVEFLGRMRAHWFAGLRPIPGQPDA